MAEPQDQVAPAELQEDEDLVADELSPEELEDASGGLNSGCTVNGNCPCQN